MKFLSVDSVDEMARSRGFKMTLQRKAIVDFLQSAEHHPTIEEVLEAVNVKFPRASRATVYNTINWLKEAGMLKEIFDSGSVRLDPNFDHHHHFVCSRCGKVEDVGFELISDLGICTLPNNNTVDSF